MEILKKIRQYTSSNTILRYSILVLLVMLGSLIIIALYDVLRHDSNDVIGKMAEKLHLNVWDWMALIVALISLFLTFLNWWAQDRTRKNTSRLEAADFRDILKNLYNNIIRNTIYIYSLSEKLQGCLSEVYPSEEYLLKLKLNLPDLQLLTIQDMEKNNYYRLHCLEELCTNFNIHLDVTQKHLSTAKISEEIKTADMASLKSMHWFLAAEILSTIEIICPDANRHDNREIIRRYLIEIISFFTSGKNEDAEWVTAYASEHDGRMPYIDRQNVSFFNQIFTPEDTGYQPFIISLNSLIKRHCTDRKDGRSRISLIPLHD